MKTYFYAIGTSPYDSSTRHRRGDDGCPYAEATTLEDALHTILGSMLFPTVWTGRAKFIEGISLPNVPASEVIQVWSSEPDIAERTQRLLTNEEDWRTWHNGRETRYGLHCELRVAELQKHISPARALLKGPDGPANEAKELSPMGASLLQFKEAQFDMQSAIQREGMNLAKRQWEMETLEEDLESKMGTLKQQLGVMNAYVHGTSNKTQISFGNKGTGKYKVYQERQFLSEEIALLANLQSFDFEQVEELEKWLVKSGAIWKFLPFERCILACRIRKDEKDYGYWVENLYKNMLNMQNIIWIRDGENVYHVDVEFNFNNAIFPDRNQFERAFSTTRDHLFERAFKKKPPTDWSGKKLKSGEYDVPGKMRRKPLEEEEPYYTSRLERRQFETLQDWISDEQLYPDLLDKQIRRAVQDHLQEVNKKQMIFCVLLQGIVDNTNLLEVPKGTDLFNWETVEKWFELVFDYSHGLPWKSLSDKIEPHINGKVLQGDWIVAIVNEYIPGKGFHGGTMYKETWPCLMQVVGTIEGERGRYVDGEMKRVKTINPVVLYHPRLERLPRFGDWSNRPRVKAPKRLILENSNYIVMPIGQDSAKQILDNREWKKQYKWAVPIMVNFKQVLKAMATKQFTVIHEEKYADD
jgi:hypothetical protein